MSNDFDLHEYALKKIENAKPALKLHGHADHVGGDKLYVVSLDTNWMDSAVFSIAGISAEFPDDINGQKTAVDIRFKQLMDTLLANEASKVTRKK
jgi:hypothetical protein